MRNPSERPLPPRDTSVAWGVSRLVGDDAESVDQIESLNRIHDHNARGRLGR